MDIGFFCLGLLLVILSVLAIFDADTFFDAVISIIGIFFGIFAILLSFVAHTDKKPKPIEYPASEYTLELKITEFQGQKDTTYVLTPKTLE